MSTKTQQKETGRLRIVSLGGVDEIGKNMYVFEYEDDIIVVDCGSVFPKEDMLYQNDHTPKCDNRLVRLILML